MEKDKIIDVLYNYLGGIYCDTCRYNDNDEFSPCDYCHRKAMSWSISERACNALADKILEAE